MRFDDREYAEQLKASRDDLVAVATPNVGSTALTIEERRMFLKQKASIQQQATESRRLVILGRQQLFACCAEEKRLCSWRPSLWAGEFISWCTRKVTFDQAGAKSPIDVIKGERISGVDGYLTPVRDWLLVELSCSSCPVRVLVVPAFPDTVILTSHSLVVRFGDTCVQS